MYSIVIQVYKFGVKRQEREIANDAGLPGVLSLIHLDHHPVLRLHRIGDNGANNKVLPSLYEPRCIGWIGDGMVWRGYQKPRMKNEHDPAPAFLQEWRLRLVELSEIRRIWPE